MTMQTTKGQEYLPTNRHIAMDSHLSQQEPQTDTNTLTPAPVELVCARDECDETFTPNVPHHRFCSNYCRDTRWREQNPERVTEHARRRRETHPDENARFVAAWRARNPEKHHEGNRRWREANPDKVRAWTIKRNGQIYGTAVDRAAIWERDEGCCGICGEAADESDWHLDHIIPLSRGGIHEPDNTQVAHPHCNCSKGAKIL